MMQKETILDVEFLNSPPFDGISRISLGSRLDSPIAQLVRALH